MPMFTYIFLAIVLNIHVYRAGNFMFVRLVIEHRTLHMLDSCSAIELYLQALNWLLRIAIKKLIGVNTLVASGNLNL